MPYVDPNTIHDPTVGQVAPHEWGEAVRNSLQWIATDHPRCRVHHNTTNSITSGTDTSLFFNSERYDVGGCHDTSTNTTRLTVPSGGGGVYAIFGHIFFLSNSSGNYRRVSIRVNGDNNLIIARQTAAPFAGSGVGLSVYTEWQLSAGDYVQLMAGQDSGGNLSVGGSVGTGPYACEFGFRWVAT